MDGGDNLGDELRRIADAWDEPVAVRAREVGSLIQAARTRLGGRGRNDFRAGDGVMHRRMEPARGRQEEVRADVAGGALTRRLGRPHRPAGVARGEHARTLEDFEVVRDPLWPGRRHGVAEVHRQVQVRIDEPGDGEAAGQVAWVVIASGR